MSNRVVIFRFYLIFVMKIKIKKNSFNLQFQLLLGSKRQNSCSTTFFSFNNNLDFYKKKEMTTVSIEWIKREREKHIKMLEFFTTFKYAVEICCCCCYCQCLWLNWMIIDHWWWWWCWGFRSTFIVIIIIIYFKNFKNELHTSKRKIKWLLEHPLDDCYNQIQKNYSIITNYYYYYHQFWNLWYTTHVIIMANRIDIWMLKISIHSNKNGYIYIWLF